MRKIVLVLTAAVMLAAVCFSGCKGAVGIDSGRKKDPIRFTAEPTQAVLPDGFGCADKRARIAFGE